MSTIIFNTAARPCLVNGKHTTEEWAAECPALGRTAAERLIAWKALANPQPATLPAGQSAPVTGSRLP